MSKATRQQMRERRRQIPVSEQLAASEALAQHIAAHFELKDKHVAVYLAFDGELDTNPLIDLLRAEAAHCYLPIVTDNKILSFMPYRDEGDLTKNRYGILEPVYDAELARTAESLDIIFAPVVAVDKAGYRLGMGGGYYDRSMAFLKDSKKSDKHKTLFIGLAYECQLIERLTHEAWDVPLQGLVTEKQFYQF